MIAKDLNMSKDEAMTFVLSMLNKRKKNATRTSARRPQKRKRNFGVDKVSRDERGLSCGHEYTRIGVIRLAFFQAKTDLP